MQKYSENIEIRSSETDVNNRLKPTAFMSIAQEIAEKSAVTLGFGYKDLIVYNQIWILARFRVVFLDAPKWKEIVNFTSWHKGLERLYYLRDFVVTDMEGRERIKATTSWLVLDLGTRALVRHPHLSDEGRICQDDALEAPADRIRMPRGVEPELACEHIVAYSDIDKNGHANNAMYMQWSMDAVGYDISSSKAVKEFTINYNREAKVGDVVKIYKVLQEKEDGLHVFLEGKVDDVSSYTVEITF